MATDVQGVSEAYLGLIREFPLRPIRDDAGLARAVAAMRRLIGRDDLCLEEDDYLDILGSLIQAYEEIHDPVLTAPEDGDDPAEEA